VRWLKFCCLALLLSPSARAAELRTAFRFAAAAPLFVRPGIGRDGAVYVGSGDGYVHALGPDGAFRWSFALTGRVIAPPVEDPNTGRVFVATSDARLYALERDSHLRWMFPLPVAAKGELSLSPKGTLFFVGQDDYLYGVTVTGALAVRLAAPGARSAPMALEGGQTGLVLGDSLATLKGYGFARRALPDKVDLSGKLALDPQGDVFGCAGGSARVASFRGLALDLASDCVAPPVRGDGAYAIAEAAGVVRIIMADGDERVIRLGATPLRPNWDGVRKRWVLACVSGSVLALDMTGPG